MNEFDPAFHLDRTSLEMIESLTLNAVAVLVGSLINGNMRECSGILFHFSLLKA